MAGRRHGRKLSSFGRPIGIQDSREEGGVHGSYNASLQCVIIIIIIVIIIINIIIIHNLTSMLGSQRVNRIAQ